MDKLRRCMEKSVHHHTRIVIRVFEDRCTTMSKDMTKLTTMPTSMFQRMERKNVSDISVRSTQAFILQYVSHTLEDNGSYAYRK